MGIDIGMTQEELREAVITKAAEMLVADIEDRDEDRWLVPVDLAVKRITENLKAVVEEEVAKIAVDQMAPIINGQIEAITLQKTNEWGEAKGEAVSFREYLVARAQGWMAEMVNYDGKTKAESRDSYNFKTAQSRISWMIDHHIQYTVKVAVEGALKDLNSTIAQGLADTLRAQTKDVLAKLKVSVTV